MGTLSQFLTYSSAFGTGWRRLGRKRKINSFPFAFTTPIECNELMPMSNSFGNYIAIEFCDENTSFALSLRDEKKEERDRNEEKRLNNRIANELKCANGCLWTNLFDEYNEEESCSGIPDNVE